MTLMPPISGRPTVVRSPVGMEVALVVGLTAALFVANAVSLEWLAVTVVLTGGVWAYDFAEAASQRWLRVGAVPLLLSIFGSVISTYRFGVVGVAAATVGAGLLSLLGGVFNADLRALKSIAAGAVVCVGSAFGVGSLVLLRLRSKEEVFSFLLVAAVSVALSWLAASGSLGSMNPLGTGLVGALGAGVVAGAVWSEDLWPTVVAAAATAVALIAGRELGSLVRSGGYPREGDEPGSLHNLDGVIFSAGAFWILIRLLV
jgi:hypothetical protein